jgi:4-hydroxybenzoate polyprenyltransferase
MLSLLPLSIFLALIIGKNFALILLLYIGITLSYSLYLKSIVIVDCIVLAALYTIRIIAGAIVINNIPSFWLVAFSTLFFFSLAFLKRYSELLSSQNIGQNIVYGRGYFSSDSPLILSLGLSSGLGSVIVMMLYLNSPEILELYNYPEIVWCTIPILLFWVSHIWLQAHRGNVHDDPVIFAIKDRISIFSVIGFFVCIISGARGF